MIQKTAIIGDGIPLDNGIQIWYFLNISREVKIGKNERIEILHPIFEIRRSPTSCFCS